MQQQALTRTTAAAFQAALHPAPQQLPGRKARCPSTHGWQLPPARVAAAFVVALRRPKRSTQCRSAAAETMSKAETTSRRRRDSATCLLVLLNLAVFLYERFPLLGGGGYPLYSWRLQHNGRRFHPIQLVTSMFCHQDYGHLSSNLFGLYIFGRAVEEQTGSLGLVVAYLFCGVFANLASLFRLQGNFVSLGASGAVFGLFVAATLSKFTPDPRSLVEFYVLGQFAFSQLHFEFTGPYRPGVDATAHIAGAVGGLLAYALVRRRRRQAD